MERGTTKALLLLAFMIFFLVALKFDTLLEFLRNTDLFKLILLVLAMGLTVTFAPLLAKQALAWLAGKGQRKPLSMKKCIELVLKYAKEITWMHGYAGHDLNIVAQRLDGTDFDCPFGWFAVTTMKFPGDRKLRMDEVSRNKLFVFFINRLNGDITYEPKIDSEDEADLLLKDVRMHGLPFDKVRKMSELEKLAEEEKTKGYAGERGKQLAKEGKPEPAKTTEAKK